MVGVLVALVLMEAPLARPTALQWDAPAECPGRDDFVAALSFRTGAARVVVETEAPTAWIDARIQRRGRRLLGTLTLRLPSGTTVREVGGTHCRSLVDALSLVAALLIDPERARLGPLPAELPPVPPAPAEPPRAPVVEVAPPEPPPAPTLPAPVPAVVPAVVAAAPPRPPPASGPTWRLGAAPHLTTAISGLVDVGGAVLVSLEAGPFLARLGLGGGTGSTPAVDGRRARYLFHLLGLLELGAFVEWRLLRFEGGAAAQVLAYGVTAPDAAEPVQAWRWLPGVGPWGRVQVRLSEWLVGLGVLVGVAPRTDTYFIDPDGAVFSNPSVFVQPSFSVSRSF